MSNSLRVRVMTTQADGSTDWSPEVREHCKWGVKGTIVKHSDSHGLCYQVEHADGSSAWYNAGELTLDN